MNPAHDLDALIDEKLFGHSQCRENHPQSSGWCMVCTVDGRLVRKNGFWPPYSTKMDDWHGGAITVIKEFNEIGVRGQVWVVHTISRISCNTHPYYHQCIINNGITGGDGEVTYDGWSKESIAHAICLAALRAIGIEVKE